MPYKDPKARAEHGRRYYAENREARDEYNRRYYAENREAVAEYKRRYRAENREARAEVKRRYARKVARIAALATRAGERWTPAEDAIVMDASLTHAHAAVLVSRTPNAVQARRTLLRKKA